MLVYHHIYKNGGSTVWDRYRDNPGAWLVPGHEHFTIPTEGYSYTGTDNTFGFIDDIRYLHCRITPGVLECQYTDIEYAVTLRDPVDRLLSGFNFWKKIKKCDLHFETWLPFAKNCWRDPPLFAWQYEWFIRHNMKYDEFVQSTHYSKKHQRFYSERAYEQLEQHYQHILFLDDPDYDQQLDNVFGDFSKMTLDRSNETLPADVINYTTRDDVDMGIVEDYLEHEIIFYEKAKKLVDSKTS